MTRLQGSDHDFSSWYLPSPNEKGFVQRCRFYWPDRCAVDSLLLCAAEYLTQWSVDHRGVAAVALHQGVFSFAKSCTIQKTCVLHALILKYAAADNLVTRLEAHQNAWSNGCSFNGRQILTNDRKVCLMREMTP